MHVFPGETAGCASKSVHEGTCNRTRKNQKTTKPQMASAGFSQLERQAHENHLNYRGLSTCRPRPLQPPDRFNGQPERGLKMPKILYV